jgi:GT2 family glycosyltransferase
LNPDTIILNHAVDVIVDFAKRNPAQGLYGGRTFKLDGSLEPSSCWGRPTLWSMIMFAVGLTVIFPRNRWLDPESLGSWKRDSVKEVGVITGCFLLVLKSIWDQLGGLDERYFMYGEDVDFSIRAWNSGWRPVICPSAGVIHEVGKSSENSIDKTLLLYLGKVSLVRIHWNGIKKWLGIFLLVMGVGIRAAFFGILNLFKCGNGTIRWQTLWLKRKIWIKGYKI